MRYGRPAEIENASMEIIARELRERGISLPQENAAIVRRVIHATADFDYAENLYFSEEAFSRTMMALCNRVDIERDVKYQDAHFGTDTNRQDVPLGSDTKQQGVSFKIRQNGRGLAIVTDTNMALSGLSRPSMEKLGVEAHCFMADTDVARAAKEAGTTRAVAAVHYAAKHLGQRQAKGGEAGRLAFVVGNAPTALFAICEEIENGLRPAFVIAVPVGFVNVVESKETVVRICREYDVPVIAAMGRKGGSTVAAAIMNALLYSAVGTEDPKKRGW